MRNRECEIVDQKSFADGVEVTGITIQNDILIATVAKRNEAFLWRIPSQNSLMSLPKNLNELNSAIKLPNCE